MRILGRISNALSVVGAVAILAACDGGGTQAISLLSQRRAAAFDTAKIHTTAVAPVAHSGERVLPDGIVYTRADVLIENSQYDLNLDNNGTTDFLITESNTSRKPGCTGGRHGDDRFATLSLMGQGPNGFEANGGYVARLIGGSPIGPSQVFATGSWTMESTFIEWQYAGMFCESHMGASGNWPFAKSGYLGLAFVIRGKTHYGWAAITVGGYYGILAARLKGYAYQTKAGESIMAGQK